MDDSKNKAPERNFLSGPWKKIHGGIWIMGLALIAYFNWWWPGILVLIGASSIVEGLAEVLYKQWLSEFEENKQY